MIKDDVVSPQHAVAENNLRTILEDHLNNGLKTEIEPRAYSHAQVIEIVAQLQTVAHDDYPNKLICAGFTTSPYNPGDDVDDEQACETCMYYLVHRRFCELPELMLPVDESWSCRLWRI